MCGKKYIWDLLTNLPIVWWIFFVPGNRHILHGGNLWMRDIALALSKEFKPQGYNIHTMALPNFATWGLSLFNKNAKTLMPVVGKQSQFDNTRVKF